MPKISVEIGPFMGEGKSLKAATADAHRQAQEALSRNFNPYVVNIRGQIGIVYATEHGYNTALIHNVTQGTPSNLSLPAERRDEAIAQLRNQMLQITWKPEDGPSHPDATPQELRNLQGWFEFQLRYQTAKDRGMNNEDAHAYGLRGRVRGM